MRNRFVLVFILVLFGCESYTQTFEWGYSLGTENFEYAHSIATDKFGNIYVTGWFQDTIDFDPGPGVALVPSHRFGSAFVQKFNRDGNFCWVTLLGETIFSSFKLGVVVDDSSNVFVSGWPAIRGASIQKISPTGVLIWTKFLLADSYASANDVTLDEWGNIYLTGAYSGCAYFEIDDSLHFDCSIDRFDYYIWKMDPNGNHIWFKPLNGYGHNKGYDIAVDRFGNVYTLGIISGKVDVNPGPGEYFLDGGNGTPIIHKLNKDGKFIWARIARGFPRVIKLNAFGDLYLGGSFDGEVDFDAGSDSSLLQSNGKNDMYLQKLDANGNFYWVHQAGRNHNDYVQDITVNALGGVKLTGTIDRVALDSTYPFLIHEDILVQNLNSNGQLLWEFELNGKSQEIAHGISSDKTGNIFLAGIFRDTLDFDPSQANYLHSTNQKTNFFIAKYSDRQIVGVEELVSSPLEVYPNPANGLLTVSHKENRPLEAVRFYQIDGKILLEEKATSPSIQLDVSAFKAGVYVLQIEDDKGNLFKEKIQIY